MQINYETELKILETCENKINSFRSSLRAENQFQYFVGETLMIMAYAILRIYRIIVVTNYYNDYKR